MPWWGVALIAARDLFVTGLRTWLESKGRTLKTLHIAKAKTTVQLVFLIGTLVLWAAVKWPGYVQEIAGKILESTVPWYCMLFVVLFTIWTGGVYLWSRTETQ